jgi:hypothetical protein
MMSDLRCVACVVSDDPDDDWAAVTFWDGSAYCAKHVRQRVAADLAEATHIDGPIAGGSMDE